MCIKPSSRCGSGWTLVEAMVGVAVFSIASAAFATIFLFCSRSFTAMANYALLDQYNRQAMDKFTSELRQAQKLTDYTSNANSCSITFLSGGTSGTLDTNTHTYVDGTSPGPITYTFDSANHQVRRTDTSGTRIMLTNCSLLYFTLGMRPPPPPTNTTFDFYPAAIGAGTNWQQNVKVVQLTWKTSMQIHPTPRITSEDVQTASVVIRKQQD